MVKLDIQIQQVLFTQKIIYKLLMIIKINWLDMDLVFIYIMIKRDKRGIKYVHLLCIQGQWAKDQKNGKGMLKFKDGTLY